MPPDYFHVPAELDEDPDLQTLYIDACRGLFTAYEELLDGLRAHLREARPRRENERVGAFNLRVRRVAIDSCRFILPASTLTNVGVTMNARSMEHAVTKLLSSPTAEERELGQELKQKGREITPTLVKYADFNPYIAGTRDWQEDLASDEDTSAEQKINARLITFDPKADVTLAAALAYRFADAAHESVVEHVRGLPPQQRHDIIARSLENLGPHDPLPREFELVDYVFELVMDYGAYREYKRHRMQSYFPSPDGGTRRGDAAPHRRSGTDRSLQRSSGSVGNRLPPSATVHAQVAPYVVTHAHGVGRS